MLNQIIDESGFDGGAKKIGSYTRAVDQHYRPFRGRVFAEHVNQVALKSVARREGHNLLFMFHLHLLSGLRHSVPP
jgi:hypothetical protein